jgi:3-oxoacyl-[acyl-carrier protein] reductase
VQNVLDFSKCLAKAAAPYGIRVNSIAPGFIRTTMIDPYYERFPDKMAKTVEGIPSRRLGETAEIANTILFLASGEASYINGACVNVDGGLMME